jgi:sec-independent protein translocase protein TatB
LLRCGAVIRRTNPHTLGAMFNIGGGELLVIVLIALIVLGPQRLPEAMRTFGRVVGEVRRVSTGFQQELRDAFEDNAAVEQASPPRRREAVPLAAAVADVDGAKTDDDDPDDDDSADDAGSNEGQASTIDDGAEVPSGDGAGAGSSVAPVIAQALDAIVPPAEPPASDGATRAESGPDLGDERAAS